MVVVYGSQPAEWVLGSGNAELRFEMPEKIAESAAFFLETAAKKIKSPAFELVCMPTHVFVH